MNAEELKTLNEERLKLAKEIQDHADILDDDADAENRAEWKAKWDELNTAYDEIRAKIDAEQAKLDERRAIDERLGQIKELEAAAPTPLIAKDGGTIAKGPVNKHRFGDHADPVSQQEEWDRLNITAFHGWMLAGSPGNEQFVTDEHRRAAAVVGQSLHTREFILNLSPTERFRQLQDSYVLLGTEKAKIYNALQAGKGSSGGYLIGQTFRRSLEQAVLDYSGVLQVAEVLRTPTGEELIWPMVDDTSNTGTRVGESQDAGTASDPSWKRLRLQAFTFTSSVLRVSRTLLRDSFIDLERYIGEMLGIRIGRKQNVDFTTGAGGGTEPTGIVTASVLGVTAASATAITFDEVIDLEHSVDPALRDQAGNGYMMHDSVLKALRKLKTGNGEYLWTRGTQADQPDLLNGRRYWINQAMSSTITSGDKTLLFGLLRRYKVRQVGQIRVQRLIERYAEYDEDAFIAYTYGDGGLLNAGDDPVKHLVQP